MDPLVKLTASDCSDSTSVMNNKEVMKVKSFLSGKACIFWWLSSSVLPERNGKEKATGKVESVRQLSMILNRRSQSARNEDHLRLYEQSQPNGILQGTCWIHLLLDFQVQFLKIVADCHLLKHLLYSFRLP